MKEAEFGSLLDELRGRVREAGREDLDAAIMLNLAELDVSGVDWGASAYSRLLRYLDLLIGQFQLEDGSTARAALERLNRFSGATSELTRLLVELEPAQVASAPVEVDLADGPDLEEVVAQLQTLRNELAESRTERQ